jgi:hypothetical protein
MHGRPRSAACFLGLLGILPSCVKEWVRRQADEAAANWLSDNAHSNSTAEVKHG